MGAQTPDCCVSCGDGVNAPVANNTRASLEVARVALERMRGAPAIPDAQSAGMTMATRAREAWQSVEILLRGLTGRADLGGQALLTEARRVDALDMDGMHALVALREWTERTMTPGSAAQMLTLPPTDAETDIATTALIALERALGSVTPLVANVLPLQPDTASRSPWAPQPAGDVVADTTTVTPKPPSTWAPPITSIPVSPPPPPPPPPALRNAITSDDANADSSDRPDGGRQRSMSTGVILGIALLTIAISSAGAFFYVWASGNSAPSPTDQGVAAYARGAKEAARIAFAKAIQQNPDDARALTYLGRISREQGSMATARQYLEKAIRIDPNSALASRELAAALLADQQYELARRFYVRALTIDPSDRVAQGFLSCSLFKLNRNEEAQRWMDRAGPGEWSACGPAPTALPSKN